MYKFIGLLALIAGALAAPRPGLLLQAQPLSASYSNSYQHVQSSLLSAPLVSAPLVHSAPVLAPLATSYANVYQKIESSPVAVESPVEEPEVQEPVAEMEPEMEPEQETEIEVEAEIETEKEPEVEVEVKAEEPVEVHEPVAVAPSATSYANVHQKIQSQPIVKASLVAAAPAIAISQPAIYAAPLIRSAAIVEAAPSLSYVSHPISYLQSSSLW